MESSFLFAINYEARVYLGHLPVHVASFVLESRRREPGVVPIFPTAKMCWYMAAGCIRAVDRSQDFGCGHVVADSPPVRLSISSSRA